MIKGFETKFYLINLKNCLKKTIFEKRDVKGGFKMFLIAFLSYKFFFIGLFSISRTFPRLNFSGTTNLPDRQIVQRLI